jgi:hypothetical protein
MSSNDIVVDDLSVNDDEMKGLVELALWLYRRIMALYPRPYRDLFALEMQAIFTALATEAACRGLLALTRLYLKEFGGLLVGVVCEQLAAFHDRRWTVNQPGSARHHTSGSTEVWRRQDQPGSRIVPDTSIVESTRSA